MRAFGASGVAWLTAACLLYLGSPLTWAAPGPGLWSPAAGLGLLLVAWYGWRRALGPLAGGAALVVAHRAVFGPGVGEGRGGSLAWVAADAGLAAAGPGLGWWLYHRLAGGRGLLGDPRAATQFVVFVLGIGLGLTALGRLSAAWLLGPHELREAGPGLLVVAEWLELALGVMVVGVPLLVVVTPGLARLGLVPGEPAGGADAGLPGPEKFIREGETSNWFEIAGLAMGASLLCLILGRLHGRSDLLGWQLWGIQVLLIVWAGVRQGPRGGSVVAAVSALVVLVDRQLWRPVGEGPLVQPLLQAHLVAQCSAALLVASASAWVRQHEAAYRRVVSQVPVGIYSARFHGPGDGRRARVTLVSAACSQLLGAPAEELLGDHSRWLACVHPQDREILLAALDQLARQEGPVTCEYRMANGEDSSRPVPGSASTAERMVPPALRTVRWARDVLAPTRDAEGRLIGWEGAVTDITEQRYLADDLRRTTSMFHALVANLPAGVFFVQGPQGQPTLVNARARQLLGQSEDASGGLEHLPRTYRLYRTDGAPYPAEELPVFLALRQGQTTMRDDIVVHRPDGRRVPLVTWAAPVQLGPRGVHDAAVWVLEDLTALHQAEAARKDSEGRLRTLIETMAEGLLVYNPNGVISTCNSAACAFFGATAAELQGRSVDELGWAFINEEGQVVARGDRPFAVARRTGRPVRNVVLGAVPAGQGEGEVAQALGARWALVSAVPLGPPPPDGPGQVVITFSDISAYFHAREAIRTSEGRYRGLVESLPVMLMVCERDLRVTYANPATTAITGYRLDELAEPASWSAFLHPEDLPRALEIAQTALGGQTARGELRYRAKDGSEKVSFLISQPRHQQGVVVGTLVLMMDVTRERQLERELARAQRMELLGRLASGVAHDFNNLLGVVLNLTDLARRHLPSEHPVHADLRRITEAGEQAVGLASQLLTFSKQRPAPPRRLDLNHVTRRTLDLLRATLPASVQITADLAPVELPVLADETQVQQVLMNLCLNARDAMPQGGTLRVATRLGPGRAVHLSVTDTGPGISDEVRRRIFEPFFSTKDTGTGLGLAVVQQIVEGSGGAVEVHSEPGAGASFDVCWPACGG